MHERDGGFSTLGMLVALLVTLALVFSTAQVYRVMSASADVQDVADAAAIAAENTVAEFMIAVRVCDAVSLSLSLTGLASMGLGIAALCTPVTAAASEALISAANHVFQARNAFAEKAAAGLDALQGALPFIAAAKAASVCSANSGGPMDARYVGMAVLVDMHGSEIEVPALAGSDELSQAVENDAGEIRDAAAKAEEAAREALEAKQRAFESDCGDNPGYCMYERAEQLAGMGGSENPLYHSVDTWNFSVALNRAKNYYALRYRIEATVSSSVKDQANSALRKRFYRYAVQEMGKGYVIESGDTFSAYFPLMPKNNSEIRRTVLYTEKVYPVTEAADGTCMMHAFSGCPNASGSQRLGSLAEWESGDFTICPLCDFQMQSMGHIAAATSSVPTGFEYHYRIVAEEAARYKAARDRQAPHSSKVKDLAGTLLDDCKRLLKTAADTRISAKPPGSYGAIALVANVNRSSASTGFESGFVSSDGTLGSSAAVSGATLIEESSAEGRNVLNSLLDGLADKSGLAAGLAGFLLDAWSALLHSYAAGQKAVTDAIEGLANAIPFASASGLGTWASGLFTQAMEDLGLQPAKTDALKAVTVGTGYIAQEGNEPFSARFLAVKNTVRSVPMSSTDLFGSVVTDIEGKAIEALREKGGSIEIATVQPFGESGPTVPITVSLPPAVLDAGADSIGGIANALRGLCGTVTGRRIWE